MKFSNKILSQTVTQLCLAKEIDHIVISPGSRNAPLTIGFTAQSEFKNYSIVDERSAAFFALGLAQQLKKPVALVCTSGSALLNYYPAIAEAYYSNIPLVVLSADRPANFVEIGDGQTIKQEQVFANHILYSANCKEGEMHQVHNETEINIALNTAIELNGPVHINVPFSEPLYGTVNDLQVRPQHVPARKYSFAEAINENIFAEFITTWNTAERKMILVGVLPPNSVEQRFIDYLAQDTSVVVLTETTSNLHHPNLFPAIDQLIAPLDATGFKELQPQLLLTFGGMVVSKKIKAFLREYSPESHYHVSEKTAYDTFFVLTNHFKTNINYFFESLQANSQLIPSQYLTQWLEVRNHRLAKHSAYVKEIPFSDFAVFARIFMCLPKKIQLQLANSATIRYAQLFDLNSEFNVFCNRGTSGIDGSTSTAIGGANGSKLPTVFITGDLSFFYDSNALWNDYIPASFRIIVINNRGGGIFRILPGAKETEHFHTYFETGHQLTAEHLCKMYHVNYEYAANASKLSDSLLTFFEASERPKLLEVFTPPEINDSILLDYFKYIK